ncbi:MAG: peptide-methionine (S)-S-oxide reductase MsrA [Planctomycetota bacterium]|jgi:peptide-methionine (S)-S-oxide reductase
MTIAITTLFILTTGFQSCSQWEEMVNNSPNQVSQPQPEVTAEPTKEYPYATFAAGCFWGVEYVYQQVPGVKATRVGFMGGTTNNPSYKDVCYTNTNHAEVVQLRYDPEAVTYERLVNVFFKMHDPTTLNRQGPDVGTQYRSAIFYHDAAQQKIAEAVKNKFDQSERFNNPIVTQIAEAGPFWKAEDYHQDYFNKNPNRSCHIVNLEEVLKDD